VNQSFLEPCGPPSPIVGSPGLVQLIICFGAPERCLALKVGNIHKDFVVVTGNDEEAFTEAVVGMLSDSNNLVKRGCLDLLLNKFCISPKYKFIDIEFLVPKIAIES
jgi:hypothetical protein